MDILAVSIAIEASTSRPLPMRSVTDVGQNIWYTEQLETVYELAQLRADQIIEDNEDIKIYDPTDLDRVDPEGLTDKIWRAIEQTAGETRFR